MYLTRLAADRPIATMMSCLVVLLLGLMALRHLPVDLMPEITSPRVSVITLYEGAGPEEVETLITRPLEQALGAVSGVERLSSASMEGSSTVRAELQWGTDIDAAIADMRQAIDKIKELLPAEIEAPYIRKYDVADRPIMYLGLRSTLPPIELTQLAERQLVPRLERLEGVARVGLRGEVRREIQVHLKRRELEARDIAMSEVVAALQRGSTTNPGGDLETGHLNLLVRSQSEFATLDEIAGTVIRQSEGKAVQVRDVADVVDGQEERTELTRANGEPAVMLYVFKQAGANTIEVSSDVQQVVAALNAEQEDAYLQVRMDQADFIRQSIRNVRSAAFYGMLLAVLVLVVFLRSFRSTLVIAVAMPLSVLATFVLIYFKGFTLNMVSFGGLALGIGLLVDNSIVVLESIFRHRAQGKSPRAAAIDGTQEVASAIVASTLTTLVVFLPLLFVQGLTSVMLNQLAWVVSMALFCSLLVSLTLTPVLTMYWSDRPSAAEGTRLRRGVGWIHRTNKAGLQWAETLYHRLLERSLRHPGIVVTGLLLLLAVSYGLVPLVGTEFFPAADEGRIYVTGEMAPGIQLETLAAKSAQVEETILETVRDYRQLAVFIGDDAEDGEDWHRSRFLLEVPPRDQRRESVGEIRKRLDESIGPVAGMEMQVRAASQTMVFRWLSRSSGGGGSGVQVQVRGHDLQAGRLVAEQVANLMEEVPGLINITLEQNDRRPELSARIDRAKASQLGVSVSDIATTLEIAMRGSRATVFREEGDEYNVLVRLAESDRQKRSDIEQVGIATPGGKIVPLRSVVKFEPRQSAVQIGRLDQQRYLIVSADTEGRDLGSVVEDLQARLSQLELPRGMTVRIAGDWEEQQESFAALQEGFLLAVVLMYMIMASQFESLRDPILILVTIPLGAIGVIGALAATGTTLNVQSFIGVVMLAGIVVNNAIVLVDYMNQLRRSDPHLDPLALVTRAAVRRFRPIMMTTVTTVLAMVPIALGVGEGGELQAPMARVVIGGLVSSTLITLLAIPLLYRFVLGTGARGDEQLDLFAADGRPAGRRAVADHETL